LDYGPWGQRSSGLGGGLDVLDMQPTPLEGREQGCLRLDLLAAMPLPGLHVVLISLPLDCHGRNWRAKSYARLWDKSVLEESTRVFSSRLLRAPTVIDEDAADGDHECKSADDQGTNFFFPRRLDSTPNKKG
jgi:hypothetical protein